MPVAAITGRLRRRIWTDLSTALGLGVSSAYAFWYFYYIPSVRRKQEFYLSLEKKKMVASSGDE